MRIKCPACSKTFNVPANAATSKGKCPSCGQKLDLARMPRPGDLKRGDILGNCRIEGLLGRGGMAVVYKATQLSLDRPVALKVLPKNLAKNSQFVQRFSREASALARLSHPNIVGILDKGVEGDTYYFVMECVEGRSLSGLLRREGSLSPDTTLELMNSICSALEYAHDHNIVHRDLKPGNVLLDANGVPKLADFGIARILGGATTAASRELTMAHSAMGSADYMAPEQREDAASVDHRADIYALGVVLYQMLTGHLPVGTFTPASRMVQGVPSAVDRVIRKALANSPAERFESVALFRAALAQAFAESPAAHATGRRSARRGSSPAVVVATVLGLVAAVAVVAALVVAQRRRAAAQQPPTPPAPVTRPATATRVAPKPPPQRPTKRPTRPVVRRPKRPKKPQGESPAVKKALASVRDFIAMSPNDYKGQLDRLQTLILQHKSLDVVSAAKAEREKVIQTLNKDIADHVHQLKDQADALADKRQFGAALRIFKTFPKALSTDSAVKKLEAERQQVRDRIRRAFAADKTRAAKLAAAGKPTEAAGILRAAQDYGLADVEREAATLLAQLQDAVTAEAERVAREQAQVRTALAKQVKKLWADSQFPEALALVEQTAAKAPTAEARKPFARTHRAATLLAQFWAKVHKGAQARKGGRITLKGVTWTLADVKDDSLTLSDGRAKVGRPLKSLDTRTLLSLAGSGLDSKLADTHLTLALFHKFGKKPNLALASKALAKAIAAGTPQKVAKALLAFDHEPKPTPKKPDTPEAVQGLVLDFNGTSDYIEVPDKRPHPLRLKTFTAEAWVWRRPGGEREQHVIAKNLGWDRNETFAIFLRGKRWVYTTGYGEEQDTRETEQKCPIGKWVHVALVCDEADRAFFVNGKLVSKTRARRLHSYDDKPLTIGAEIENNNIAFFWNGAIDEVRVSKVVRYRKDFVPERRFKLDRQTMLLLHLDDAEGRVERDATKYKNHGRLLGPEIVRADQLGRRRLKEGEEGEEAEEPPRKDKRPGKPLREKH